MREGVWAGEATWSRELVERALAVTGSGLVSLHQLDPVEETVVGVAWAGRPRTLVGRAIRFAQQMSLDPTPVGLRCRADANRLIAAVHLEGRTVLAPFAEVVAGAVDPQLVDIARAVLGLRQTLMLPVHVGGPVVGSLAFHSRRVPTRRQRGMAEAFAHQAALALEHARLCAELEEQRATVRMIFTAVLPQVEAVMLLGREVHHRLDAICAATEGLPTPHPPRPDRPTRFRRRLRPSALRPWDGQGNGGGDGRLGDVARLAPDGERAWPDEDGAASLRPVGPAADRPADELTAREREVAVLVALGLTNRQIGAELSIAKLTADKHVANILSKLGLVSRTQVAVWAIGRGLLAAPSG